MRLSVLRDSTSSGGVISTPDLTVGYAGEEREGGAAGNLAIDSRERKACNFAPFRAGRPTVKPFPLGAHLPKGGLTQPKLLKAIGLSTLRRRQTPNYRKSRGE
jgi:hypothetical protein